jgi:hypothetical protein
MIACLRQGEITVVRHRLTNKKTKFSTIYNPQYGNLHNLPVQLLLDLFYNPVRQND